MNGRVLIQHIFLCNFSVHINRPHFLRESHNSFGMRKSSISAAFGMKPLYTKAFYIGSVIFFFAYYIVGTVKGN